MMKFLSPQDYRMPELFDDIEAKSSRIPHRGKNRGFNAFLTQPSKNNNELAETQKLLSYIWTKSFWLTRSFRK